MFQSINPFDQQLIAEHPADTASGIDQKIAAAHGAFLRWKALSFEQRGEYFLTLADYLRQQKEQLAGIMTDEMGKILAEARSEIEKCAVQCEYFAAHSERLLRVEVVETEAQESTIVFEPVGVVLAIMPWNFPFWQVFRYAVPALMAGNATLLKHAPNVLGCAKAIEKAFAESGFPAGVFQNLFCENQVIETVLAHPFVAMVTLTGSERAGASVAATAARNIKKSVLELGGSDALIVLQDADLEAASTAAVASRMMNAGQVCIAAKRLLVHNSVKKRFMELITQKINAIKVGNPRQEGVGMGPLARLDLAQSIEKQYDSAVLGAAKIRIPIKRSGCFVTPCLLEIEDPDSVVFKEETFGPLAVVMGFETPAQAVELANGSVYGLSAAVWTRDATLAKNMAQQLEVGSVFINAVVRSDARLPIGGTKKSGYGRELSEIGIREFCQTKVVYVA